MVQRKKKKSLRPVNPFCTGGGGPAFECLVGVSYLISLLRQDIGRGTEGIVRQVRLQQRNQGHVVDDINVVTELGSSGKSVYLQVKHRLRFSNNKLFNQVIGEAWREFTSSGFKEGFDKIGFAICDGYGSNVRDIVSWASTYADAARYFQAVQGFPRKRKILDAFEHALGIHSGHTPSHLELWRFLKHLTVVQFDFDDRDGTDCWNRLLESVDRRDPRRAKCLFEVMRGLVAEFAPKAGEIDRAVLANWIKDRVDFDVPALRSGGPGVAELLLCHLANRVRAEKNSRKYIPNVFVEVGQIKQKARLFCDPALFLQEVEEDVRSLKLRYINGILAKAGLKTLKISLPQKRVSTGRFVAVDHEARRLQASLECLARSMRPIADEKSNNLRLGIPSNKSEFLEQVRPYLSMAAHGIVSWTIPGLIEQSHVARSRVFVLVGRAGQGKTNFVCDLLEHFVTPRRIPCLFLTGRELRGVRKGQLCGYIAGSILGANVGESIDSLLQQVEGECARRDTVGLIVIDGLNEHDDLGILATEVEHLIEKCLNYPRLRVMLTCRSEYFEARFANLGRSSFADLIVTVRDLHREMEDSYKKRLLAGYLSFFNIRCRMDDTVQTKLASDPLLLRFFCEAYACTPHVLTIGSICKDALFRTYMDKKLAAVAEASASRSGYLVGTRHPYQSLLRKIIDWMIEHSRFDSVPVNVFGTDELTILTALIDEDIFLTKELAGSSSVLSDRTEVVGFTFAELRDFLLADHLLNSILPQDAARCEDLIQKLTDPKSTVSEGVGEYLFFGSRLTQNRSALRLVERQTWYREHFLQYVFDLEDEVITEDDVCTVREICGQSDGQIPRIFTRLILRYDKRQFPKLNISLLFDLVDAMTPERAASVLEATFGESRYAQRAYYRYPITKLVSHIHPLLTRKGEHWDPSFQELGRLLLYLWEVRDEDYGLPARQLFAAFDYVHPEVAADLIRAHTAAGSKGYRGTKENEALLADWRIREDELPTAATEPEAVRPHTRRRNLPVTLLRTDIGVVISSLKRPTLGACLSKAKVHAGSYAAEIVERLYGIYVEDSIDLKAEFKKYYQPEYQTIEQYLYQKYGCGAEYVEALRPDLNSDRFVGLLQKQFGRDWGAGSLGENDDKENRVLSDILGAQWV